MADAQSTLNMQEILHQAMSDSIARYQQGDIKTALALTQQALLQFPDNPALLQNASGFAGMLGDLPLTENYIRQGLALHPDSVALHNNLGLLLYKQENFEQAIQCYQTALKLNPDNAGLHNNLGLLLYKQENFEQAIQCYQTALKLNPTDIDGHNNLGALLQKQKHFDEAKQHYQAALKIDPDNVDGCYNLGWLLQEQERFDEAKQYYQTVLKIDPDHFGVHNNLGVLLYKQGHFDEAKQHYHKAAKLKPNYIVTYTNLSTLLLERQHFDEAMQCCQAILKIDPDHAATRCNLAILLLRLGRFSEAWLGYEYRYHPDKSNRNVVPPNISTPQYQGQTLMGKSLLIVCEQGFGDNIQCIRYLPLLKQDKGVKHLALVCDQALSRLFNTMDCIDKVMNGYTMIQTQNLDYWVFIMSLPLYFNTILETIPNQLPYLSSPKEQQKQWQDKLPKDSFNIGLVWKGRTKPNIHRSISSLSILKPLWQLKQKLNVNIGFISLQKGADEDEAANPPLDQPMTHLGTQIQDFADSAAIVSQLDLVISVDTAMVHLAGSLNIPCWVLLPHYGTDWRWLIDREDSPWYPDSMRLFIQKTEGDWEEVIERVAMQITDGKINGFSIT